MSKIIVAGVLIGGAGAAYLVWRHCRAIATGLPYAGSGTAAASSAPTGGKGFGTTLGVGALDAVRAVGSTGVKLTRAAGSVLEVASTNPVAIPAATTLLALRTTSQAISGAQSTVTKVFNKEPTPLKIATLPVQLSANLGLKAASVGTKVATVGVATAAKAGAAVAGGAKKAVSSVGHAISSLF